MMFDRLNSLATVLLKEPPFRIVTRLAVKFHPVSILTKANWDVVAKPQYLVGLIHAAHEAKGMGAYHGFHGFERFSHKKGVLKTATWIDIPLTYAPYGNKLKILRKIML